MIKIRSILAAALTSAALTIPALPAQAEGTTTKLWWIPGSQTWGPNVKPQADVFAQVFPRARGSRYGYQLADKGQCGWMQKDVVKAGAAADKLDDDGRLWHDFTTGLTEDSDVYVSHTFVWRPCKAYLVQVDTYRPRTAYQAKLTASLDDDGWLHRERRYDNNPVTTRRDGKWEDTGVRRSAQVVPVELSSQASGGQVGGAAAEKLGIDVTKTTSAKLATARKGGTYVLAWAVGTDPAGHEAQRYLGRVL